MTNGHGADATIVTIGVVRGEHVAEALASIRKAGSAGTRRGSSKLDELITREYTLDQVAAAYEDMLAARRSSAGDSPKTARNWRAR